ncbi:MAG TPA: hypothetical protein VG273_14085, partial [Bryobacteraceae bacterium]|nr:hypothetical protein [Bryobacteraceae bacterium]
EATPAGNGDFTRDKSFHPGETDSGTSGLLGTCEPHAASSTATDSKLNFRLQITSASVAIWPGPLHTEWVNSRL